MEKVLCVARKDIPAQWVREIGETALTGEFFFAQMKPAPIYWLDRAAAEKNPEFKQIIPYVVFQNPDRTETACYQRNGSEKRLAALWSVGIGGHINPEDGKTDPVSLESLVRSGLKREIAEEIGGSDFHPEFVGVINEERTPVGSVHFGLVYRLIIRHPDQLNPSDELSRFHWIETGKAGDLNLELWSVMALDLLKGRL